MNANSTLLFSFVLLLAIFAQKGAALKCYQCTATSASTKDPCYDPRSSKDIKATTCSEDLVSKFIDLLKVAVSTEKLKPVCMKTDIKIGKETIVRRDCAMVPVTNLQFQANCQKMSQDTGGVLQYCGVCEQDGCNLTSRLQVASVTALLTISLLINLL